MTKRFWCIAFFNYKIEIRRINNRLRFEGDFKYGLSLSTNFGFKLLMIRLQQYFFYGRRDAM